MKQILITILFLLASSAAFSNSLQNSHPDKQLPLAEAFALGERYKSQNADSALYYLGLITSRYNEKNIGELKEDEQKLVAYSYYYQAMLQAYIKSDYEASVRSLMAGEKVCNDDTVRFRLQQTMEVVLIGLATAMPTADNRQLAYYYAEQCFRKARQLHLPIEQSVEYVNLFFFGMDEETRRRNRWATDLMLERRGEYDIVSLYADNYCRAIDCLDQKKPAEALVFLQKIREQCLPFFEDVDLHFKAGNLLSMAYVFQEMGQRDSFFICTRQCETIARQNGYSDVLLDVYNKLVSYYDQVNTPQQAAHYKRLGMDLRDSLFVNGGYDHLLKSGLIDKLHTEETEPAEEPAQWWHYAVAALLLLLMGGVAFFVVRRRKRSAVPQPASTSNGSYQNGSLSEERKDAIYQDIMRVMADTTIITNPNFTITQLAECIQSNQKYVSQVINERTGSNFNNLLASHRVDEVCRRMENAEEFGNLTMEAVGQSVGFGSRASFFNAFKRFRGIAPSEYMKTVRDNNSNSGS